jgi:hypothetical protein
MVFEEEPPHYVAAPLFDALGAGHEDLPPYTPPYEVGVQEPPDPPTIPADEEVDGLTYAPFFGVLELGACDGISFYCPECSPFACQLATPHTTLPRDVDPKACRRCISVIQCHQYATSSSCVSIVRQSIMSLSKSSALAPCAFLRDGMLYQRRH